MDSDHKMDESDLNIKNSVAKVQRLVVKAVITTEHTERFRQALDIRHSLFKTPEPVRRLKSRKGYLRTVPIDPPDTYP